MLPKVSTPTLVVHGTKDKLVEIEGAQHGFAVHDDPKYLNLRSQEWQAFRDPYRVGLDYREVVASACRGAPGARSAAPRCQRASHSAAARTDHLPHRGSPDLPLSNVSASGRSSVGSGSPAVTPPFYPERTVVTLKHHMTLK